MKIILHLIILFFFFQSTYSQTVKQHYLDGRVWVKFKGNYHYEHLTNSKGQIDIKKIPFPPYLVGKYQITECNQSFHFLDDPNLTKVYELVFNKIHMVDSLIRDLGKLKSIEFIEPKPLVKKSIIPNDSFYINTTGDPNHGGPFNWAWPLDNINAAFAWQYTTGDPNIKIAIVDDAVWTAHPDLSSKVVSQYNSVTQTNDCNPPMNKANWQYDFSHGTHVAGIAAAATNNGIGIASIGYDVSIIGVRITNDYGSLTHAYEGLAWASTSGADVINMSWGGGGYSNVAQMTIDNAHANGIIMVAAAGNSNSSYSHYPASYNHVISVASLDQDFKKSAFSNFGSSVDISAPGGKSSDIQGWGILSCVPFIHQQASTSGINGHYQNYQGTSMAAPIVSGLAGLLFSYDNSVIASEVDSCMIATAKSISSQNPSYFNKLGSGQIDAREAMECIVNTVHAPIPDFEAFPKQEFTGNTISFYDYTVGTNTSILWQFPGGTPSSSSATNPTVTYSQPGFYDVSLTATNVHGTNILTKTNYIEIINPNLPFADFYASPTSLTMGGQVHFTDNSTVTTGWQWEFPGGNPSSANGQGPHLITYSNAGTYNVKLIASNGNNQDTLFRQSYIVVQPLQKPTADFYGSSQNIPANSNNNYWDISTNDPTMWYWKFPGGNPSSSTQQTPTGIMYDSAGVYDVELIACNSTGCDTILKPAYISVYTGNATQKPIVDIFASPNLIPIGDSISVTVTQYAAPNIPITNSYWEFPGGDPPYAVNQAPDYITYNSAGSFDIKYIACNAAGCDTVIKSDHVMVSGAGWSLTPCDTLCHFSFDSNVYIQSSNSSTFSWNTENNDASLPPRFLETIEILSIPNNYGGITEPLEGDPDMFFEFFDQNNNLIHTSDIVDDQLPFVEWPLSYLLYDMQYKVQFWDYDLLIDDDLGLLYLDAHSTNTLSSNGITSMEWTYHQNNLSTYWKQYSESNSNENNYFYRATSNFNPPGQADDWFMFGPVTIPNSGAKLYWEHRYPINQNRGAYQVYASTAGMTVNDFLSSGDIIESYSDNDSRTLWNNQWSPQEVLIDSSIYAGQDVYFAINHIGNDQYFFEIDNILVKNCNSTIVDINEVKHTGKLKIYPNPFNNNTTIDLSSIEISYITIELYDISGKCIKRLEDISEKFYNLDMSELSSGTYILKVYSPNNIYYKKLILQD